MSEYGLKSIFRLPGLIVFGSNIIDNIGKYALEYGNSAVILYGGRSFFKSGAHDRIASSLKKSGVEILKEIGGVTHDPDEETVNSISSQVRDLKPSTIIGAGGGSVIDVAKSASVIATNGGEVGDYWKGKEFTIPSIPCIVIPTTSGTGSEVTKNAVITGRNKTFKKSIRTDYMIPDVSIVDPTLTLSVPPDVTAYTGLDALIQNIEAFTSKNSGPITDTFARKAIELSGKYLLRGVKNPHDLESREALSLVSLYGGINLLHAGLGLAHGLSHPIGIRFGIPHGKACAIVMPKVIEYNYSAQKEKYIEIGMLLGGEPHVIKVFNKILEELEISTKLSDYGIREENIPEIVEGSKGGSRNYNPVPHSDAVVAKMLREML